MEQTKVTKDSDNKTLIIEHVFDAPKSKIWRAYSDKEWFEKWWGPEGWETKTKEFNFMPNGRIHYCMECVDESQVDWFGKESWGVMEILSINEGTSFTGNDNFSDAEGVIDTSMPTLRFEVELLEENGKTRLVSRSVVDKEEQLEELLKMGMVEGFSSQLKRLEFLINQ